VRSIFYSAVTDSSFSDFLPSSSTNEVIQAVKVVLGDRSVVRVFSLDLLGARGVELLPSLKSSSVASRVTDAQVPFLLVLPGLANLSFLG
jgi:hypothetical protein